MRRPSFAVKFERAIFFDRGGIYADTSSQTLFAFGQRKRYLAQLRNIFEPVKITTDISPTPCRCVRMASHRAASRSRHAVGLLHNRRP